MSMSVASIFIIYFILQYVLEAVKSYCLGASYCCTFLKRMWYNTNAQLGQAKLRLC
jgi:hypothetical protein